MATSAEIDKVKHVMSEDEEIKVPEGKLIEEEVHLKTHQMINTHLCGEVTRIFNGSAQSTLETNADMVADREGLVHSGFIFSSALYAAMAALNDPNAILVGADTRFLAPIEEGNIIDFEAKVMQKDTKKREVKVSGMILDIKIFEGTFHIVTFDRHVLKLKLSLSDK